MRDVCAFVRVWSSCAHMRANEQTRARACTNLVLPVVRRVAAAVAIRGQVERRVWVHHTGVEGLRGEEGRRGGEKEGR